MANRVNQAVTESDTPAAYCPSELRSGNPSDRLTIALETSSRVGSIAIGRGDECLLDHTFSGPMQHATELVPALQQLTQTLGRKAADIGEIIVSIGPGSFTGVRISVMVARTLSQVLRCKLIAVPTTEVLALNAPVGSAPNIGVVLDARRGMIFGACYRVNYTLSAPRPEIQVIMEPTLGSPETLPASWPEPIQLLGEGIEYHRAALSTAGFDDRLLPAETAVPRASALYQLGRRRADRGQFVPREALLPLYLRKPEAEEVWEKRQGASTDAKT